MIRRFIPAALKRWLGESVYFWRYRHLLTGDAVWRGYAQDWASPRRQIYPELCRRFDIRSVFEFGCASGTNLLRIEREIPDRRFCFLGVDISDSALSHAKNSVRSKSDFYQTVAHSTIEVFLKHHKLVAIDLAIYDRVLYILTEAQVHKHLTAVSWAFRYVIVDDFFPVNHDGPQAWSTKDYVEIFRAHGFRLLEIARSEHKTSQSFHEHSAKRAIFIRHGDVAGVSESVNS